MEEQIKWQGHRGQATQAPCSEGAFVSSYWYINTHRATRSNVHTHQTNTTHLARRIHQETASFQAFPTDSGSGFFHTSYQRDADKYNFKILSDHKDQQKSLYCFHMLLCAPPSHCWEMSRKIRGALDAEITTQCLDRPQHLNTMTSFWKTTQKFILSAQDCTVEFPWIKQ